VINANALGCLSTVKIVDLRNNKLINFDVRLFMMRLISYIGYRIRY